MRRVYLQGELTGVIPANWVLNRIKGEVTELDGIEAHGCTKFLLLVAWRFGWAKYVVRANYTLSGVLGLTLGFFTSGPLACLEFKNFHPINVLNLLLPVAGPPGRCWLDTLPGGRDYRVSPYITRCTRTVSRGLVRATIFSLSPKFQRLSGLDQTTGQ